MAAERDIDGLITNPPVLSAGPPKVVMGDYQQTPDIGKLAAALAKAQGQMHNALKDSKNPHFNSAFADLESVVEAIKGPLAEAEIARIQLPMTREGGEVGVRTQLVHSSGQWVAGTVWCKAERPGPQAMGSVITYLRRYSLAAAAGVAPADDDGEAAEGRGNGGPTKRESKPPPRQQAEKSTQELDGVLRLTRLLSGPSPDGLGWPAPKCKNWLKKYFHVDASSQLSEKQMADAIELGKTHVTEGELAYRAALKIFHAEGRIYESEAA